MKTTLDIIVLIVAWFVGCVGVGFVAKFYWIALVFGWSIIG